MTQTTGAISFKSCKIEASVNGSSWTDISGFANEITVEGGERQTGEENTFDGETPILLAGKRGSYTIKAKIVYTEGASDPQEVARAAYEAASAYYLRWSPKGQSTGTFLYTSSVGVLTSHTYPGGNAKSGEIVLMDLTLKCGTITKSVNA